MRGVRSPFGYRPTYAFKPKPGARPTGKLAKRPIRNEASAEIAAVDVIKSLRTAVTQDKYTSSLTHRSEEVHLQVPPVSEIIDALTVI